jgi:hypothetical protein
MDPAPARAQRFASALAVLLLVLGGTGCTSSPPPHKFTWRTLSRGLTSGLTESRRLVIRDQVSYFKLWTEHAVNLGRPALPPTVDFNQEMVVVVALGNQPTGGHFVEVVDAQLRGRSLIVFVGERHPQPGVMQMQMATQPYQFIALPALAGRVEFRTVHPAGERPGERKARPGEQGASRSRSPPS